jgi:DNA-binding response OmpR family regulator
VARILLVEDDHDVCLLMEQVLLDDGYTVDPTGTLAGARTLLSGGGYDLVLADGMLPDGTGMHIAEEAERQGVSSIVITAYAYRFPKRDLARYGLLLKPVRPAELLEAVKVALPN